MRNNLSCLVCNVGASLAMLLLGPMCVMAADATLSTGSAEPADLVKAALRTELDGPSESRKQLLDEALARDPDFAPARWHSGFVRFDGQWLKVEDVPRRARGIEHLADYRKLRDKLIDTADNHRALARWCHKNKLSDEERVHWAKVLEFEHSDAEALEALGLQLYNGRLLTKTQIEQEKKQAGEARRAMQRWQPQMVKWRKAIEHGNPKQLDEALRGLKELSDPAAIPALEIVFAINGEAPKQVELNKLLIETVGRIPVPEATQVLLRRSIIPDSLEVRTAAADELKKRPMLAYVPPVLSAMPGRVATRFQIYFAPDGSIVHEHEAWHQGWVEDHIVFQSLLRGGPINESKLIAFAFDEARQIDRSAEWAKQINDRIQQFLAQVTDFKISDDPRAMFQQWLDYSESYALVPAREERQQFFASERIFMSCFSVGTPVVTIVGQIPIERIRVGDAVLAQNPQTGELAYKTVQGVTLRPSSKLIEIGIGSESIRATRGHPFWVCGQGWLMAKQLEPGMLLHRINGAEVIGDIRESPASEAYNLVVSEFGTYFVGENRLLVHDNMMMNETTTVVPGLPADSKASSVAAQRQAQP